MIASPTHSPVGAMTEALIPVVQQIADRLDTCSVPIELTSGHACLYFAEGRLVWAESNDHRWRRWYRLLRRAGVEPTTIDSPQRGAMCWEYAVLVNLVNSGRIAAIDSLVEQHVFEVLFDILQEPNGMQMQGVQPLSLGLTPLIKMEGIGMLQRVAQRHQDWQDRGLKNQSPNLAPLIRDPEELQRQTNPQTYQMLSQLVRGQLSLRDLAAVMQQDLQIVVNVLLPYIYRDVIIFQSLADLAAPDDALAYGKWEPAPPVELVSYPSIRRNSLSILCIDDNLQVCEILGRIISAAGYHYYSIQDSIEAIPTLLEHKPDLIFLDLVMPIASGYEVCSQIRRVSAFKHIPVVILTGNDGIIDRIRSKACGATDFIAKPLEAAKVLAAIKRHVPVQS